MTESVPSLPGGDMTTADFLARAPEVSLLTLRVTEIVEHGTGTRQIRLAGDDLAGFRCAPGQDVMVVADASDGRIIRRRYTIRRIDTARRCLDLHVVTDSAGPGARWAVGLRVGDVVEAIGPRGKITLADAVDWHLLVADDVAVPAVAAMVEALPPGARAIVFAEVATAEDATAVAPPHDADVSWTWLPRDGRAPGEPDAMLAAATGVPLPPGPGHAYVFGEAGVVRQVRAVLAERGVPTKRMSTKAYWGRGRANASHGEPLKDISGR